MADANLLAQIAQILKGGNTFGGNTFGGQKHGGNTFGGAEFGPQARQSVSIPATPPPLPAFGMPGQTAGNSLPPMASYMKQAQAPAAPQMAQPAPGNTAPQGGPSPMADPSMPPMPPPVQIGAAPGMGTDPASLPALAALLQRLKQPQDPSLPNQMAMGQYPGIG